MKDKLPKPPAPAPAEKKATPPPDDPARRSAEWDDLGQNPEDAEKLALLRLEALRATRMKDKP